MVLLTQLCGFGARPGPQADGTQPPQLGWLFRLVTVRTVRILEEASQEAIEVAAWYEHEQAGLGAEFFAAVDAAIDVIEENLLPLSPLPKEAGDTGARRMILEPFPYETVAIEMPEKTLVIAVSHHSRKPGYWLGRSKP
jgi:hypothetical protein